MLSATNPQRFFVGPLKEILAIQKILSSMKKDEKNFITLREADKISGYSAGYLAFLARKGKLKAIKIGKTWVTKREWLNQFLKKK